MLVPLLIAATLLTQTSVIHAPPTKVHAEEPAVRTGVSFTITVPAIPEFGMNTLSVPHSRSLIPLTTTLIFDREAEAIREEQDLVAAINTERTSRGLGPLSVDPLLCDAARAHCREMCDLNYFAHRSPTPGDETPADRYLEVLHTVGEKRPASALVGENIFYASVTNDVYGAGYAHQRLMASPSHRENILEPRFTKVGVGLYRDPEGRFWVTEMFLRDR